MSITTLATVHTLLNLSTETTDDAWITALIPRVESDYVHIRNKPFDVGTLVNIETSGLPADETITISFGALDYDIELIEDDTAGMITRRIINQIKPTAYYDIFSAATTSTSANIYFVENYESWLDNESVLDLSIDASTSVVETISKMQIIYPAGSEMTAAQMIQHQMSKPGGIQSESLGDYSVTYGTMQGGYPQSITGQITRFAVTL